MAQITYQNQNVQQKYTGTSLSGIAEGMRSLSGMTMGGVNDQATREISRYTSIAALPVAAAISHYNNTQRCVAETHVNLTKQQMTKLGISDEEYNALRHTSPKNVNDKINNIHNRADDYIQKNVSEKYLSAGAGSASAIERYNKAEEALLKEHEKLVRAGAPREDIQNVKEQLRALREGKSIVEDDSIISHTTANGKPIPADLSNMISNKGKYELKRAVIGDEFASTEYKVKGVARVASYAMDAQVKLVHSTVQRHASNKIIALKRQLVGTTGPQRSAIIRQIKHLEQKKAASQAAYHRYQKFSKIMKGGNVFAKTPQEKITHSTKSKKIKDPSEKKILRQQHKEEVKAQHETRKAAKSKRQGRKDKKGKFFSKNKKGKNAAAAAGKRKGAAAASTSAKGAAASATTKSAAASAAGKGAATAAGGGSAVAAWPVIIIAAIFLIIMFVAMAPGFVGTVPVILHYVSDEIRTDYTGALDNVNYCQAIANLATYDLGYELETINKTSAYDELTHRAYVGRFGIPAIPYEYQQPNKIYVWEECDNETRWKYQNSAGNDVTGELIYKDYYISDVNQRNTVTVYDNIVPIMNMMHTKMLDDIDYEHWHEALAYVYYMFAMSHNTNRFNTDDNRYIPLYDTDGNYTGYRLLNYGGTNGPINYCYGNGKLTYTVYGDHAEITFNDNEDSSSGIVSTNVFRNGGGTRCKNAYYHDGAGGGAYSAEAIVNLYQLRRIYGYSVKDYSNEALMRLFNTAIIPCYTERQLTRMGFVRTDNNTGTTVLEKFGFRSNFGGILGNSIESVGIMRTSDCYPENGYTHDADGNEIEDGDRAPFSGEDENAFANRYGNRYTNVSIYASTAQTDYGAENWQRCHNFEKLYWRHHDWVQHEGDTAPPREANVISTSTIYDYDSPIYPPDENGEPDTTQEPTGYEVDHYHYVYELWEEVYTDSFRICCGHCGGHVTPSADLIEMMTYEGLAQLDGFKTVKMESAESIIGTAVLNEIFKNAGEDYSLKLAEINADIVDYKNGRLNPTEAGELAVRINDLELGAIINLDKPVITTHNRAKLLQDRYKDSEFVEIRNSGGTVEISGTVTFLEWRACWNDSAKKWFSIFPSTPKGMLLNLSRKTLYTAAGVLDWATNAIGNFLDKIASLFTGETGRNSAEDDDYGYVDYNDTTKDMYDFQGWFNKEGSGYNEDAIQELYDFYGGFYEDQYSMGIENWEGFEVIFDDRVKLNGKTLNIPPNYKVR